MLYRKFLVWNSKKVWKTSWTVNIDRFWKPIDEFELYVVANRYKFKTLLFDYQKSIVINWN